MARLLFIVAGVFVAFDVCGVERLLHGQDLAGVEIDRLVLPLAVLILPRLLEVADMMPSFCNGDDAITSMPAILADGRDCFIWHCLAAQR